MQKLIVCKNPTSCKNKTQNWTDQNFLLFTYFWKLNERSFEKVGLKWSLIKKIYTHKTCRKDKSHPIFRCADFQVQSHFIYFLKIKFIYSEKATKFSEIFPLLLTVCTVVKSKVMISQNFVAFSEYMNFIFRK